MKTKVKIAIIGAIATVLAAVVPVVIFSIYREPAKKEDSNKSIQQQDTKEIYINNSQNVVTGEINAKGDVIIGGTKTINIQALTESQNNGTTQKNEHIYSE